MKELMRILNAYDSDFNSNSLEISSYSMSSPRTAHNKLDEHKSYERANKRANKKAIIGHEEYRAMGDWEVTSQIFYNSCALFE
jgi:hypothetical protein